MWKTIKCPIIFAPTSSSSCTAMFLYCYLVCNYNKCALSASVCQQGTDAGPNIKKGKDSSPLVFEIGSSSDLVLENTITDNLMYTIPRFAEEGTGKLTFQQNLIWWIPSFRWNTEERSFFRMSVNRKSIIKADRAWNFRTK